MAFTTLVFALFTTILIAVYFFFPVQNYQWVILLIGSYAFYLFAGVKIVLFMVFTTVTTYAAGRLIENNNNKIKSVISEHKETWSKKEKKAFRKIRGRFSREMMILTLLLNFGVLFLLKYSGCFLHFKFVLPLGISFYTFQSMGYLIDVYRRDAEAERNLFRFALFVSFFPQIIQGPISRFDQLAHQLYAPHKIEYKRFKFGLELILWGLFKKLVIADRATSLIATVRETMEPASPNGTLVVIVVLLYALQLYADFSAGIDIARGIAQILGIDMIQNFRQPYFSISLTDYWNRWHISLGAWMRDYIFYPIALSDLAGKVTETISKTSFGKSRVGSHLAGVLPGAVASLLVFLIVGIWHGAGWKYICFGLWNGLVIMTAILIAPVMHRLNIILHLDPDSFRHRVFRIIRTFIIVCVGYYFDVAVSASQAFLYLKQTFIGQNCIQAEAVIMGLRRSALFDGGLLFMTAILLFVVSVLREGQPETPLRERIEKKGAFFQWILLFTCIMTLLVLGIYGPGYNPQDFVYMQF